MPSLKPPEPRRSAMQQAVQDGADAAIVGFDWPDPAGVMLKVREELDELSEALDAAGGRADAHVAHELGDLLMALCSLARALALSPDEVLASANGRFRDRFQEVEALSEARGLALSELSPDALDGLWREAKARIESRCRPLPGA